jgi:hypothetical protein
MSAPDIRSLVVENEIRLERKRPEVFDLFVNHSDKWFQFTYGGSRVKKIVTEPRVGGQIYEDWGDGAGVLYGTIRLWDPPEAYAERSAHLGAITLDTSYRFEEDGDHTVIKQRMVVFGPMDDQMEAAIRFHGSLKTFEENLRAWIERGEVIDPPSA